MVVFGLYQVHTTVNWSDYDIFIWFNIDFKVPITRRYIRNPNQEEFSEGKMLMFKGDEPQVDDKAFVPVEIKAGK
jgi:hypothetical protein